MNLKVYFLKVSSLLSVMQFGHLAGEAAETAMNIPKAKGSTKAEEDR